jgi:hypothetical protein
MSVPAKGFLTLIAVYIIVIFGIKLLNFSVLSYPAGVNPSPDPPAPFYAPGGPLAAFEKLVPKGPIPWESAITCWLWVAILTFSFVMLEFWPFNRSPKFMKQPMMGIMVFAFAVNRGIEATHDEFISLLNNDIELDPNWLGELHQTLIAHPETGACGPKLMRYRERERINILGIRLNSNGEVQIIGATTGTEYKEILQEDEALSRKVTENIRDAGYRLPLGKDFTLGYSGAPGTICPSAFYALFPSWRVLRHEGGDRVNIN